MSQPLCSDTGAATPPIGGTRSPEEGTRSLRGWAPRRRTLETASARDSDDESSDPDYVPGDLEGETLSTGAPAGRATRRPETWLGEDAPVPVVSPSKYAIDGELARGGLGRILRGWDRRLDRPVAIKVALHDGVEARVRFMREVAITARLQHPAIVPVYEAGCWPGGEPFYAMKLISGCSLKEAIAEKKTLDERLSLLPNVIAVAEAVAYAHSVGIIHRDLKPANILVGPFGETVVIDWGVAREASEATPTASSEDTLPPGWKPPADAQALTETGAVLGTPAYMPPEQASGAPVDMRADVYAIGAILYHILAGIAPYDGGRCTEVVARVLLYPPERVELREPGVPLELADIVRKAMARAPEERYASAMELAEELKRFQTGQLVGAHHYTSGALARRWVRRHRVPVAVGVAALGALLATGTLSLRRIIAERRVAESRRIEAEAARDETAHSNHELLLAHARSSLDRDPTAALAWLLRYPLDAAEWPTANMIAADAVSRGVSSHVYRLGTSAVGYVAFSPDGRRLAAGTNAGNVSVFSLQDGAVASVSSSPSAIASLSFFAGSEDIVFSDRDGNVVLHNVDSGRSRRVFTGQGIAGVMASSGDKIAAAFTDGTARLWDNRAGTARLLARTGSALGSIAFSRDGKAVAFAGVGGGIHHFDVASGLGRSALAGVGELHTVVFSPDGRRLALGGVDGSLWTWDTAPGSRPSRASGHAAAIQQIAFSPGGEIIATASDDRTARLWARSSMEHPRALTGHSNGVCAVAFNPGGTILASASQDGVIKLWSTAEGIPLTTLRGHTDAVWGLAFSPDGRILASAGGDGTLRTWAISPQPPRVLSGHRDYVYHARFSPDGASLATESADRSVRLWDVRTGEGRVLGKHLDVAFGLEFSPDGKLLATAGFDGTVRVWDQIGGQAQVLSGHRGSVSPPAFSPDAAFLASGGSEGDVRLWDILSGTSKVLTGHRGEVRRVAFSPVGTAIASAGADGDVRVWNTSTLHADVLSGHTGAVFRVSYSPDGRYVASGGVDGQIILWDTEEHSGRLIGGHGSRVNAISFSADGTVLVSGDEDGTVSFWDARNGDRTMLRAHDGAVVAIGLSRDGQLAATSGQDMTIRLWNPPSGASVVLRGHEGLVADVSFSPDGTLLASASWDRTVRLWPTRSTTAPPTMPWDLQSWIRTKTTARLGPDLRPATEPSHEAPRGKPWGPNQPQEPR